MSNDDINARLSFLGIDDTARRDLREARSFIVAALPGILDGFYIHIDKFQEVARMFPNQKIKEHAKQMQLNHWALILSADFDERYVASVRKIGETHNRLGLEPRWYIAGYAFIINAVISGVSTHFKDSTFHNNVEKRNAWLTAINKAAMLDMDFAISVYLEAGKRDKHETLEKLAQTFDDSVRGVIDEVATSASHMQQSAQKLAEIAKESKERSVIVAAASIETSQTSSSVASASEELSAAIREISKQVQNSSVVAKEANDMAQAVNSSMLVLLEQTKNISQVTDFIDNVAGQINLLALNATIESARAGDAGKGFAVVAAEVKNLAGQTTKAAGDIGKQVQDIQLASSQAEDQIKKIVTIIEQISSNTSSIAAAIEEQSAATNEIAKNVTETSAASNEVSRNITIVEQGAEQTNVSSTEILGSAGKLTEQAALLRTKVDEFLNTVKVA